MNNKDIIARELKQVLGVDVYDSPVHHFMTNYLTLLLDQLVEADALERMGRIARHDLMANALNFFVRASQTVGGMDAEYAGKAGADLGYFHTGMDDVFELRSDWGTYARNIDYPKFEVVAAVVLQSMTRYHPAFFYQPDYEWWLHDTVLDVDGNVYQSFHVWRDRDECQRCFPDNQILALSYDDIEDPIFVTPPA